MSGQALFKRGALAVCLGLPWLQVPPEGLATLRKIYDEVRTMNSQPGLSFLKQDFFIGGPDDDDTNKDIHVAVLIQSVDGADRMQVQITYLERSAGDPRVKYARETRSLACSLAGGGVRLIRSDFVDRDIPRLADEILQAIKDKKRLIRSGAPDPGLCKYAGLTTSKEVERPVEPDIRLISTAGPHTMPPLP
jgi:hypothetical protein